MQRSNETWLAELSVEGPEQQAALSDLRSLLLRTLGHAFRGQRQLHAGALLEDSVQEALVRILERLPQFEGRSRFVTWATSIAIRVVMTEMRRRRFKDVSLDELVEGPTSFTPPVATDDASNAAERSGQREIVDRMYEIIRDELTEKQRSALLAELRGMPQVEVARHLGSSRNALYKLVHDARRRVKRGLEAAGFEAHDVKTAFGL